MTTTDERVEITPELLADLEKSAASVVDAGFPSLNMSAATVLALVKRIRELESTNNEIWRLFEEAKAELGNQ